MSRIFITYRREDTSSQAGRIYDWLREHYGDTETVFKDVDSIEPGRPWRQAIETAVGNSDVVLALIGPRWLDELEARPAEGDFVRYELETALETNRRVIPLLVNGARMPGPDQLPERLKTLPEYQAFDVSDLRFRSDMEELIRRLDRVIERPAPPERAPTPHPEPEPAPPPAQPQPVQPVAAAAAEPDAAAVDAELAKWNWGAFLLTFIWGIAHGVVRSLLVFIPIYGIYEWIMLGRNGNRWAWEKRRWESLEQFRKTQRSWAKWGVIVTIVVVFLLLASSGGNA